MSKALVLLSGGQDSTTCLAKVLDDKKKGIFTDVEAICFDYGQRHQDEISCASNICKEKNVKLHKLELPFLEKITKSSLFEGHTDDLNEKHSDFSDLPTSFVPGRNALFLTLAFMLAIKIHADHIYIGVSQVDYSGYPDCREDFLLSMERSLNLSCDLSIFHPSKRHIFIDMPFIFYSKADIFDLANNLGWLDIIIKNTRTCYSDLSAVALKHFDWGNGCGKCPACKLRKAGFEKFIEGKQG